MDKADNFDLITSVDLFEYIDILLFDPVRFEKITDNVKNQHFFMLQRRLAIAFPEVVNHANLNGINQVAVTNMYHKKLCVPGGSKPRWHFTKSAPQVKGAANIQIEDWQAKMICKVFELDRKTWESILVRKPSWVEAMVRIIDRSHKSQLKNTESLDY